MHEALVPILPVFNLLDGLERFHMGIAMLSLSALFQGFVPLRKALPAALRPAPHAAPRVRPRPLWQGPVRQEPARQSAPPAASPALRVLRFAEHEERPGCAGRMVISGRMADVCAELDRLAARELRTRH